MIKIIKLKYLLKYNNLAANFIFIIHKLIYLISIYSKYLVSNLVLKWIQLSLIKPAKNIILPMYLYFAR